MPVLISIRPEWVRKIECIVKFKGDKPVYEKRAEMRKGWFVGMEGTKFFIYETKGPTESPWIDEEGHTIFKGRGMVVGEFICNRIDRYTAEFVSQSRYLDECHEDIQLHLLDDAGEEVAVNTVTSNGYEDPSDCEVCKASCLSFQQIKEYIGVNFHEKKFANLYISDLKIYKKPKPLERFYTVCRKTPSSIACCHCPNNDEEDAGCTDSRRRKVLRKAPQNYCFVEERIGTCFRCGSPLFPSLIDGYKSQCYECDEDFYECEQETYDE